MSDMFPIAIPAVLVVVTATVMVRRERSDRTVDPSPWDHDVAVVPVRRPEGAPTVTPSGRSVDGALVEPGGSSLGARIRRTLPEDHDPVGRRVRGRRRRPLVAARSDR